jgi:hypothetical protein
METDKAQMSMGIKLSLHQETRYVGPGMVPCLLMQGQSLSIGELQLW